ncbi:unnamed protein product [Orchesella dallaii]|uniref:Uncharacterized protein n=1 Tax=Orchesella dallaii TaxID=48710 RepID=A0ABP1R1G4_9HEXA
MAITGSIHSTGMIFSLGFILFGVILNIAIIVKAEDVVDVDLKKSPTNSILDTESSSQSQNSQPHLGANNLLNLLTDLPPALLNQLLGLLGTEKTGENAGNVFGSDLPINLEALEGSTSSLITDTAGQLPNLENFPKKDQPITSISQSGPAELAHKGFAKFTKFFG